MILEITKIIPFKNSQNEGDTYLRITFVDRVDNSWYKTDIVPGFRNYKRWRRVARVGNTLSNLIMKNADTVDADSHPIVMTGRKVHKDMGLEELAKLGTFG